MIDLAAAVEQASETTLPDFTQQIVSQNDVERFNAVYGDVSPQQSETQNTVVLAETAQTPVEPATMGEKILQTIARLDGTFESLFAEDAMNSAKASSGSFDSVVERLTEVTAHATQVSLWSTEIGLVSTSVSKGSQGIQTLFRNSG